MAHQLESRTLPRDNEGLSSLHEEVAVAFKSGLPRYGECTALMFGDGAAQSALRAVLFESEPRIFHSDQDRAAFDRLPWRSFLMETPIPDPLEMTQFWRNGAEYAGQGLVPHERSFVSMRDRKARVRELVRKGKKALLYGSLIVGAEFDFIWRGVAARAAIDGFEHRVTLDGLHLLSNLPIAVIRNAVNTGDLPADEHGTVSAEQAQAWLGRRREFCPSRWHDPHDNQWPFDPNEVVEPDGRGMVWVPQSAEGDRFTPERVIRAGRDAGTISITVGAKGEERQYRDYYEALRSLAKMEVARWRRPNSTGNWGIVRARGAWVAVERAEIERQLATKLVEVSQ